MTEIFPLLSSSGRGFGWDINTDYSTVRGDLFGYKSYGHSGYTGLLSGLIRKLRRL
jgi:hypothetical protein